MADLKKVRDLPDWGRAGGVAELWMLDGDFIVISTVNISDSSYTADEQAMLVMGNLLSGYATSGEETIAFNSDEHGEVEDWGEVALVNGSDSRARLIAELLAR